MLRSRNSSTGATVRTVGTTVLSAVLGLVLFGGGALAGGIDFEAECNDFDDFRVDPDPRDETPMIWNPTPWNLNGELEECAESGLFIRNPHQQSTAGFLSEDSYTGNTTVKVEVIPGESTVLIMLHWSHNGGWGYSGRLRTRNNGTRRLVFKRWGNYVYLG